MPYEAEKRLPGKVFYVGRIGKYSAAAILFYVVFMLLKYKDNMPIVGIRVSGSLGKRSLDAHIDFASSMTVIPYETSEQLGLEFRAYAGTATGGGVVTMPTYAARVEAFARSFDLRVGVLDLPEENSVRALVGRDILDSFKVCLDGKKKEFEVTDA